MAKRGLSGHHGRLSRLALHAAAGVVIAVVAVELMPQAVEADPPWVIVLSFVLGAELCYEQAPSHG